ncbi:two-component regulator propeller domain-containing protein [uncultured Sphingobacterium sp.]|uniref:hybrid sensor histidine kinase/response regulator transcription factor n=1 Tax=uncultured Sphingobacterium sp. TaxID=182688 RepID=UPI0025DB1CEB|nr:two-component regulator propeller domain-containing protein [uncultured Sphingobacterium sp.]
MRRDLFSIILLLFAFIGYAHGQATRIYDNRDYGFGELSSNLTTSISQDKHGYIWTGTEYGLNKFDGTRFVQYLHDVQDSTSISSNNIIILYLDRDKRLWVGCNNGLQYYDENSDQFVRIHFPDQIAPHITDIIHKKNGHIWVATSGWGIFDIQVSRRQALSLPRLNTLVGGMFARSLFEDRMNRIWVAIDRVGVSQVSADQKRARQIVSDLLPMPKGGNYDIVQQHDGKLLFASPSKISRYDPQNNTFEAVEYKSKLQSTVTEIQLSKGRKNHLLISTEGDGLWYLDLEKKPLIAAQAELPNLDNDYRHARIRALLQDRENNLWLGWFQRGLIFIPVQSKQFEFWRISGREKTDQNIISAITRDRQGNIWYAVEREGVFKTDRQGISHQQINTIADINKLEVASDGTIWFSSYDKGLGQIDPVAGQSTLRDICPSRQVKSFALGKNNKIYIATFGSGFVEYDLDTKIAQSYSMNTSSSTKGALANDWIATVLCADDGLIWLGHHKGVSCFDPTTKSFTQQYTAHRLSEQITISLLDDHLGHIWAGTYNGLYQIDKKSGSVSIYTTNNGLSSNVITGLGSDKKGNIWCSTFKGINCLNAGSGKIVNYYTGDGLVDRSYNRSVHFQDTQGKIYYGGRQGITLFFPEKIQLQTYPHPVLITNLYVKNQPIKPGMAPSGSVIYKDDLMAANQFFFHSNDDSFTFELSTMDFNSPENVHYEYRIKGINKSWNATLPGVNLITYNNLSSGEHELEIRACKFGIYSPSLMVTLHIQPPWYLSGLAYFVYILFATGIIFLISKYLHERRLERLHAFRLQLFTDVSHEIRSPLTLVMSPIDKLMKNAADPQTRATLQNMNRNAQRILSLVNQLLDIRKLESGHMNLKFCQINAVDYVKQIISIFEDQALSHQIQLSVHNEADDIPIWIDVNSFEKILHNVISNAFKFTPRGGQIAVSLTVQQREKGSEILELVVSDTGSGIAKSDLRDVFRRYYQSAAHSTYQRQGSGIGLHLTKVLVELHGGQIHAENRSDCSGSLFVIRLPMGNTHLRQEDLATVRPTDALTLKHESRPVSATDQHPKNDYQKTGYKVLVIDDDRDILHYLQQELSPSYKVLLAENGGEGFQLALAEEPDLIISDVAMPLMDGYMLVKKLKGNSTTNHIPVVLLTAKTNQEDRLEGIGRGADAYLTKPFMVDELHLVVLNLIKNRMKVKGKFSGAQQQEGKVKTISFKSSDEQLMERIVKTVNQYLENSAFNVQFLADEVGLSRVQLHRKVKSLTGISTGEFIRNIRLQQAEKLLLEKKMNISQVAYSLGFTNQTHFTTLFKKMYGLSPTEYIQRHSFKEN